MLKGQRTPRSRHAGSSTTAFTSTANVSHPEEKKAGNAKEDMSRRLPEGRLLLFPLAKRFGTVDARPTRPKMGLDKVLHRDLTCREGRDADHQLSARPTVVPFARANEAIDGRGTHAEARRESAEGKAVALAVGEDGVHGGPFMRRRPNLRKGDSAGDSAVAAMVAFPPPSHNGGMHRGRPKKAPAAADNRVLELRTKHGLTQQQLGKLVGHDSTWVYKVESGVSELTWPNAVLLGDVFGEHPGDLYRPSRRGELTHLLEMARYFELMTPEEQAAYALLARSTVQSRLREDETADADADPAAGNAEKRSA